MRKTKQKPYDVFGKLSETVKTISSAEVAFLPMADKIGSVKEVLENKKYAVEFCEYGITFLAKVPASALQGHCVPAKLPYAPVSKYDRPTHVSSSTQNATYQADIKSATGEVE